MSDCTTETPLTIPLPTGARLPGILTSPPAPARGFLLLLHGMASHHNHSFAPALAAHLSTTLRAHVLRYTSRGPTCPEEPTHRFRISGAATDDVHDLTHALAHAHAQALGPLLALVGHSRGANVILFHAASAAAAAAAAGTPAPLVPLVCLSPRHHLTGMVASRIFSDAQRAALAAGESTQWVTKAGTITVTPEDVAELAALGTMASTLAALPPCPLLLVHGTGDATIPHTDSEAMAAARPQHTQLVLLPKAKHNYDGMEPRLLSEVAAFLGQGE